MSTRPPRSPTGPCPLRRGTGPCPPTCRSPSPGGTATAQTTSASPVTGHPVCPRPVTGDQGPPVTAGEPGPVIQTVTCPQVIPRGIWPPLAPPPRDQPPNGSSLNIFNNKSVVSSIFKISDDFLVNFYCECFFNGNCYL